MRLRPDSSLTDVTRLLGSRIRTLSMELANVHNAGALNRYLDQVNQTERLLRDLFADTDLVDALHSERYWHIRGWVAQDYTAYLQEVHRIADLMENELRVQTERLQTALDHLRLFLPLADRLGCPLILDTNVLIHFDPLREQIDQARWYDITQAPGGAGFRLIIPVLVLDELDRHAHSGNRRLSRRARAVLGDLDRFTDAILANTALEIRPDASWMTVEILPDAPNHRRQADNDTELLDRAEFLYQVTGQQVTFVTADRGMRVRGKVRDLLPPRSGVRMVAMPEELRVADEP